MDKDRKEQIPSLLANALQAAKEHGLGFEIVELEPIVGPNRAAALLRVIVGPHQGFYTAELRAGVRPAALGATLLQLERLGPQALLVTDYVTPQVAEVLKNRQIAFVDGAGNAYLKQPNFLIWVTGRKPATTATTPRPGRAFQPNGLQVLFTLLCNPAEANAPLRKIARMAGVAHGTAGVAMKDLADQGFITELKGKRGTRRLHQCPRLLDQWTDAYIRLLRPRNLIGRYYVPAIDDWRTWNLDETKAQWGGEPAAALLTEYLIPGELTIYTEKLPGRLAAMKRFAREPGPGHKVPVEVRRRFWNFDEADHAKQVVPPPLVYADLLATTDARCIEAAKIIRDNHVARLFSDG